MSTRSVVKPSDENSKVERFLRLREVMHRTGLPRASIYEQMAIGLFPKPVALSFRSRGWIESEIEAWIEARIQARQSRKLQ